MSESIEVLGLRETMNNLNKLDARIRQSIVKAAIFDALTPVRNASRSGTYTTFNKQTGLIQSGWGRLAARKVKPDSAVGFVIQEQQNVAALPKTAFLNVLRRPRAKGSSAPKRYVAFWWLFMEKGTQTRQTALGANRGAVTPRPWIAQAFDQSSRDAVRIFDETIRKRIDKAISELPKTV